MARESCNLDKDDAEILKPPSPSSASPSPLVPSPPPPSATPSLPFKSCEELPNQRPEKPETPAVAEAPVALSSTLKVDEETRTPVNFINRCSTCRKRVRLTGFRCRCGDLFCGQHRYSDAHDCSFDYKAVGREEIAKANPVIRAAKIIKI